MSASPPPRIPCDYGCVNGLVPHKRRMLDENTPDPWDQQTEEICPKCHGSGTVPYVPAKTIREHVDEKGG